MWLFGKATAIILADLARTDSYFRKFSVAMVWMKRTVLTLLVAGFWLTLPPLLVGGLFDIIVLHPIQFHGQETPRTPLFSSWAMGLVFLKLWCK